MGSSLFPHFAPIVNGAAPGGNADILPTDFKGGIGNEKGPREAILQITPTTATVVNLIDRATERGGAVKATAQIQAVPGEDLVDGDEFTLVNHNEDEAIFEVEKTVKASGQIQAIPKADFVDGQTFTLDDGTNTPVVFEIDKAGDGVTGGRTAVDISTDDTDEEVAARIIAAINGVGAGLKITASENADDASIVDLLNDVGGTDGNTSSADDVVDTDFTVSDMAGGLGGAGVTEGSIALTIPDDMTAAEVAAYLVEKINEAEQGYVATVNADDDTLVDLVQAYPGTDGNQENAEDVDDEAFTVSNFEDGTGETASHKLNAGAQVAAGARYSERIVIHDDRDYNVQIVTDGIIIGLSVSSFR